MACLGSAVLHVLREQHGDPPSWSQVSFDRWSVNHRTISVEACNRGRHPRGGGRKRIPD